MDNLLLITWLRELKNMEYYARRNKFIANNKTGVYLGLIFKNVFIFFYNRILNKKKKEKANFLYVNYP